MNGQRSHVAVNCFLYFPVFLSWWHRKNGMRIDHVCILGVTCVTHFFYCAKLTATTLPWQLFSSVFFLLPKDALLVLLIRRELFQAVSYETRSGSINKTIYHSCLDASVPEFLIEEYIIWIRAQMRRTNHFQPKALS